ncbi:lysophospholipid acyltransferase family protein [uncultured Pseudodesulfovibrio sp.]|uniref:lysophospholipid acyltransferase family protein n=1 Tax=uncultured Pseudodesulfovibrio sp. TaxID=2035858 RepID=UPI0029C696B2|nr:lysophospholipid acyltransferase family protein [uncultured Pseudodesulfovibrio sp.]
MKIPIDPAAFAPFIAWLFKLWVRTLRFKPEGHTDFVRLNKQGQPIVVALWHGEIFPVTAFGHTLTSHLVTFVSQSKDGEVIARMLERIGHTTVRGSSTRGGVRALIKARRIMEKENRMAVFTIDGPKGPRHKAKEGVIFLAQLAGAKIVPLRAFPKRKKVFEKSWDRFVLPMPFTRCPVYIGEPMEVTTEKLTEEVMARETARLEARMHELKPE